MTTATPPRDLASKRPANVPTPAGPPERKARSHVPALLGLLFAILAALTLVFAVMTAVGAS